MALLVGASAVSFGLGALWAASYPLPDPRHNPGALGAGMFAAPFVCWIAAWWLPRTTALKVYLSLNILAFGLVAMIYSRYIEIDLQANAGAVQKIGVVVMLGPLVVLAGYLLASADRPVAAPQVARL
jgi:hypothetical protein